MAFKLTSKDIAALEGLITRYIDAETVAECAAFYKAHATDMSSTVGMLRRCGINIPRREANSQKMKREFAEFREWKRMKEAEASRPTHIHGNGLASWNGAHPV